MKRNKILIFIAAFSLLGLLFTACDDKMYEFKEITVTGIALSQELSSGVTLEVGEATNVANNVTLTPENATVRAQNFSSSDPEVASVNGKGVVAANSIGTCDITITVGNKSVSFTMKVVPVVEIPFETLEIAGDTKEMRVPETFDLSMLVNVTPLIGSKDNLVYSSSDPTVVTVSAEGLLEAVGVGNSVITVSSRVNPTLKDVIEITTYKDHDRTGWLLTASHVIPTGATNSDNNYLYGPLDGNVSTILSLVKPGKSHQSVSVPSGADIFFTIDMGAELDVSYFRILHRKVSAETHLRWRGFDEILSSDDNTTFTMIAANVEVTDWNAGVQESPKVMLPTPVKCRYLKFVGKSAFSLDLSAGNTVQMAEFYMGTTPPVAP